MSGRLSRLLRVRYAATMEAQAVIFSDEERLLDLEAAEYIEALYARNILLHQDNEVLRKQLAAGSARKAGNQTWWGSIVEAKANILIGFGIAYVANLIILPWFGVTGNDPLKNLGIAGTFTLISILRQLFMRRFFNGLKFGHTK